MSAPDHILDACDKANRAFKDGTVLDADRRTLELWLVALCDVKPAAEETQKWNLRRADAIKYLLQVRVTESLSHRTFVLSVAAFAVSVLALAGTGWKVRQDAQVAKPPTERTHQPPQTNLAAPR